MSGEHPAGPLAALVAVMDRLRSPGGCPWDAEQTHESLARYCLEEAYEVVEAIETGDRTGLREELGDLLLQVVFHARVAQEHPEDPFDLDDVASGLVAKLVRRHPHVFAGASVDGAAQVNERWEQIKAAEKSRTSVLDGVPVTLPALSRAQKVVARAERAGLGPPVEGTASEPGPDGRKPADPKAVEPKPVDPKVVDPKPAGPESVDPEPDGRVPTALADRTSSSVGERLLDLVVEAQRSGVDAEQALRGALRGLEDRVRERER